MKPIVRKCGNCVHFVRSSVPTYTIFGKCLYPLPKTVRHLFRGDIVGGGFETRSDSNDHCNAWSERRK